MKNLPHLPLTTALASVLSLTAFSAPAQAFTLLKGQEFLENIVEVGENQEPKPPPEPETHNILYLNSTRGHGIVGTYGNFRKPIADALDNYKGGTVFNVDFEQTHEPGSLASWLNDKPIGYYDQIWFDTTIYESYGTYLLNQDDLVALNNWARNDQPEFILDSAFFYRNKASSTLSDSATSATINQALALQEAGGGIFIGTDDYWVNHTANQILDNFGFDNFFASAYNISPNAAFVGDLLLDPEPVGTDFFSNHLAGLWTSHVPVGIHELNENGGNRTIEIYEQLYSYSPGKVVHIGASFRTDLPEKVPEPSAVGGLAFFGLVGLGAMFSRKRKSN